MKQGNIIGGTGSILTLWINAWRFIADLKFLGGLGFLIWQIAFPYAAFLAIKTLYLRAKEIKEYPDSDYVVAPIVAILIKTHGEMIFIFLGVMSVPAMLLTWLAGADVARFLSFLNVENIFFLGILAFVMSWVAGFLVLLLAQCIAEWTLALFSIANDANILRRNSVPVGSSSVAATSATQES